MTADQPMGADQPMPPPGRPRRRRGRVVLLVLLALIVAAVVIVLVWANWKGPTHEPRPIAEPITVSPSEPFTFGGYFYEADWEIQVVSGTLSLLTLSATNTGDYQHYPLIDIVLENQSEPVAVIRCLGTPVKPGETTHMQCTTEDPPPSEYDRIVIEDGHEPSSTRS